MPRSINMRKERKSLKRKSRRAVNPGYWSHLSPQSPLKVKKKSRESLQSHLNLVANVLGENGLRESAKKSKNLCDPNDKR